jgi:uncharacterized membrane protein
MRIWFTLLVLLCLPGAFAAQLTGTVYTEDLQLAKYSLLTINTTPAQRVILTEGTYTISVPKGTYELLVTYNTDGKQYEDSLNITVVDESTYSYDFVVFRAQSNTSILPDLEPESTEEYNIGKIPAVLLLILIIALALILSRRQWWKKPVVREMPADLESIIVALKKEGGRATQKELRKHIPCSEAKMSLMLTELEAKGKIERIKKGRGNLIVLK